NGENPVVKTVYEGDKDIMALFPAVASDLAGNLYATWSDRHGIFLSISRDHAETWSAPKKISSGAGNTSTVFPFVIAGSRGRVALAWLGTKAANNDDTSAEWHTFFAMTTDALTKNPTWTQVIASDHVVHKEAICLDGLNCQVTGGNRSLAEVLQMGLTRDGRVLITYPGTSAADLGGWSYVAEQRFGPGLYANVKPTPPSLVLKKRVPGGIFDGLLKRVGTSSYFFVGGEGGSGASDADGNQIDAPGDVGSLSNAQGDKGHVASANLYTTTFAGVPLVFDGASFAKTQIIGGKLRLTAFMKEPAYEAASAAGQAGTINISLLDVDAKGTAKEIAKGGTNYVAGVDATKGTYVFDIPKPWEVLKGHHLQAKLSFTIFTSGDATFYYGNAVYPSSFTVDRFEPVIVQGTKTTKPVAEKGGHLPATGIGDETTLGILLLVTAALVRRRLARTA
ncbi:MAG: sialidase family protein, partial [Actinomycetota bacterium]